MIFKRPWILVGLIIGYFVFSVVAFVRLYEALTLWDFLAGLPVAVPPVYQAATGLLWGLFGLAAVVGMWRGKRWGRTAARILAVTYAGYYWIDQVFIAKSEIRATNWPFLGAATVLLLILALGGLALPMVNNFFGEDDDQKR